METNQESQYTSQNKATSSRQGDHNSRYNLLNEQDKTREKAPRRLGLRPDKEKPWGTKQILADDILCFIIHHENMPV